MLATAAKIHDCKGQSLSGVLRYLGVRFTLCPALLSRATISHAQSALWLVFSLNGVGGALLRLCGRVNNCSNNCSREDAVFPPPSCLYIEKVLGNWDYACVAFT